MRVGEPLNRYLYQRLCEEFGRVAIACPGESAAAHVVDSGQGRRAEFLVKGEYYRVNCPFCNDTKLRLWVNHRWGRGFDEFPDYPFWHAAVCFNEECLRNSQNLKMLKSAVYSTLGRDRRRELVISEGILEAPVVGPVQDPGDCILLDQLSIDHPANSYLVNRGFDPFQLARDYKVSYCQSALPAFRGAEGRIIVPIIMEGEQLNWQGRYFPDVDWKRAGISKYYNCPGVSKRALVYGLDAAKALPFCIIVEGVTDVWAIGPGAVCILGKSMSGHQFEKIKNAGFRAVIVMLDADAKNNARDLIERFKDFTQVVNVEIPENADPAAMAAVDYENLWDLIYGSASAQNVDLMQLFDAS